MSPVVRALSLAVVGAWVNLLVATMTVAQAAYPADWFLNRYTFKLSSGDAPWTDARLNTTLTGVARRLERSAGLPVNFVDVEVAACPVSRAEAHQGGWILFCLPLMLDVESEDELAFLVAHEMAHVVRDDLRGGADTDGTLAFDASVELAADALGLKLAVGAGYSPEGAVEFLARVQDRIGSSVPASEGPATARRMAQAQALIQQRYQEQSDSRELRALSANYLAGATFARGYLTDVDDITRSVVQTMADMADRGGEAADSYRHRGCQQAFSKIKATAATKGYTDLLLHLLSVTNMNCMFYTGTKEAVHDFIATYVDIRTAPMNSLAVVILSVNATQNGELSAQAIRELRRRWFIEPPVAPGPPSDQARLRRLYAMSAYSAPCWMFGMLDTPELNPLYFSLDARTKAQLGASMGGAPVFERIHQGCAASYRDGQAKTNAYAQRWATARMRGSGNTAEQARNIAYKASRLNAVSLFVNDLSAVNGLVNRARGYNESGRDDAPSSRPRR